MDNVTSSLQVSRCSSVNGKPSQSSIRTHSPLDRWLWRWGGAGERGQRGDVEPRHLGEIGEIHLVDGVTELDALLDPQILVLVVVILDRDREADRGGSRR